jgi:serine/threonine-protein kinase
VTLTGAPPITVIDTAVGADGLTWSADGYLYYDGLTGGGTRGLMRVRPSGGSLEQMTTVDTLKGEVDHFWPHALPDGRGVLFTIQKRSTREATDVAVLDSKTGTYHTLVRGLTARYSPTGHLVYVTEGGDLMAAPFDLRKLAVTGEAFALTNGVAGRAFGAVDLVLSNTGTLMYEQGAQVTGSAEVVYVTRQGLATTVDSGWTGNFQTVALSPNGRQLAVSMLEGREHQVWIKQLPEGPLSKLTFDGTENYRPAWTPDGSSVGFISNQSGRSEFWVKRADGSAPATLAASSPDRTVNEGFWSNDGRWLLYRTTPRDLFAKRVGADTGTVTLVDTKFEEFDAALSPDGRWLAYSSNESGQLELYVRPFPGTSTAKWQVSTAGGAEPHWTRNGRELLFVSNDGTLTAVQVLPGPTFTMGTRQALFSVQPFVGGVRSWDITPDDDRFLMIRIGAGGQAGNELIVVENLFPELKQRGAP